MWHACADGRIGESCQLVAIEPANPWRRFLGHGRQRVYGRAEAAHLRVSDVRRVGFPLALRAARIGHRDEHAVMRFRAEPKHTARVGVRHHAVGVLVAHVIKDEEQRVAFHRRVHGGARAQHATHLSAADREICPVTVGWRHLRVEHREIAVIDAVRGPSRSEWFQADRP